MDMKSLFNDFKNYVDAMDIQAVKKNIQEAVEHSADSHILDGQIDENKNSSKNVSTQQMSIIHCASETYAFSSIATSRSGMSFDVSERRNFVA